MVLVHADSHPAAQSFSYEYALRIMLILPDEDRRTDLLDSFYKHAQLFSVQYAPSLQEASQQLHESSIDIVIIDAQTLLEESDRLLTGHLQEYPCPVITVTDKPTSEDTYKALWDLGVSDCVYAPCAHHRIAYMAMRAMREWRYYQEQELLSVLHKKADQHFRQVFTRSVDATLLVDAIDGSIFECNSAFEYQFGYSKQTIIGKKLSMLFASNKHHDTLPAIKHIRVYGSVFEVQEFEDAFGNILLMDVTANIIPWENHPNHAVLITLRDVREREAREDVIRNQKKELETRIEQTAEDLVLSNASLRDEIELRKEQEEKLKSLNEALRESLNRERDLGELKSAFVNMVSHEFRTPLSTISTTVELLLDYWKKLNEAERTTHLKAIERGAHQITEMMEELLILGQIQSGKLQFKAAPIDLRQLWSNLLFHMDNNADEIFRLKVEYEIIDEHKPYGDMRLLVHILLNLITNALKYSEDTVYVKFLLKDKELTITVTDTGIGIPKDEQQQINELFFRASNASNINGVGIGMFILNQCVKLHKGSLHCTSKLNEGSTFTTTVCVDPDIHLPHEK